MMEDKQIGQTGHISTESRPLVVEPDSPIRGNVGRGYLGSFDLHLKTSGRSTATRTTYRQGLRDLVAYLERTGWQGSIMDINREVIERWLSDLLDRASRTSANIYLTAVRRFFAWGLEERELAVSPTEHIPPVRGRGQAGAGALDK